MSRIADKIRKIIAKAEGTTNPDEAATFMAKAQQMLEAEGLSMLDLGRLDSDDPIGSTEGAGHWFAAENYLKHVGASLAEYYGCEVMFEQVGRNKFQFGITGRESARVTFELMFPFVVRQIRQLAREMVKAGDAPTESRAKTRIGNALHFRLEQMLKQNNAHRDADSKLRALVPVDEIKLHFESKWPNLRESRAVTLRTSKSARDYANRVNINRQTGGGTVKRIGK